MKPLANAIKTKRKNVKEIRREKKKRKEMEELKKKKEEEIKKNNLENMEHIKYTGDEKIEKSKRKTEKGEPFHEEFLLKAMRNIVEAPKICDPSVDVLVLGAWGCGAFGCDPALMAHLFAQALAKYVVGRGLYSEVVISLILSMEIRGRHVRYDKENL